MRGVKGNPVKVRNGTATVGGESVGKAIEKFSRRPGRRFIRKSGNLLGTTGAAAVFGNSPEFEV